jgi:hypothetical protein
MGVTLAGLDRLTEAMRDPIRRYADLVSELAGANAKALTLFGAIAAGSFDMSRHTARNVLVLGQVDLGMLRRLAEHGKTLGKERIQAPLVMTPEYIKASLDTFPLEFIEIKQQHLTIFGEEYFEGLEFDDVHVRLQCERELKTTLIGLRQGLLAAAGRQKVISALEMDVGEGLMRTLRGMLWLKGKKEGMPGRQVLTEIEKMTERKLSGLHTALDPSAEHGWSEFESLYRDVETLGEIADAW